MQLEVEVSSLANIFHLSIPQSLQTPLQNSAYSFSIMVVDKLTNILFEGPVIKLSIKVRLFSIDEISFHTVTIASMTELLGHLSEPRSII